MSVVSAPGSGVTPAGVALLEVVGRIGRDAVAPFADDVDRSARFPHEAIGALRAEGMLGALVPARFGGQGCSYTDIAAMCTALGRHCSSAAMIFAMHQIQVVCIVEHCQGTSYFDDFLREIATEGRLIASATTEAGTGGDVRSSICAVESDGQNFTLEKDASVISYGEYVDDVLVTARREPGAATSDQVIVHVQKPKLNLEPTTGWDTLGMRGTRSIGFMLRVTGSVEQVAPVPYAEISSRTMLPVSHITWSALWLGIAEAALERARAFVRHGRTQDAGNPPTRREAPGTGARVDRSDPRRCSMRASSSSPRTKSDPEVASSMTVALHMNNLKVAVSRDAARDRAVRGSTICGLAGYRNDSEYSLSRLLRDAHSASLMVHNDRIIEHNASLLCALKDA